MFSLAPVWLEPLDFVRARCLSGTPLGRNTRTSKRTPVQLCHGAADQDDEGLLEIDVGVGLAIGSHGLHGCTEACRGLHA